MIDLSQEELKFLVALLDSASFRLLEAPAVLPLRQKLANSIIVEPKKEDIIVPATTKK